MVSHHSDQEPNDVLRNEQVLFPAGELEVAFEKLRAYLKVPQLFEEEQEGKYLQHRLAHRGQQTPS